MEQSEEFKAGKRLASKKWRAKNHALVNEKSRLQKQALRQTPEGRRKLSESSMRSIIKRKKIDPLFNFNQGLHCLLHASLKVKGWPKTGRMYTYLGCSFIEFVAYFEKLFQPGMSWENKGEWHIDHIKPCKLAQTPEDFKVIWHYTNLQPLWAKDNLKKGSAYNGCIQRSVGLQ